MKGVLQLTFKGLFIAFIYVFCIQNSDAVAQTKQSKSRLSIVATNVKTTIWVSDFPKNSGVVLFDENNNLLTITTTNDFGAAYITLPNNITSTIYAKTINGEVSVSKQATRNKKDETKLAVNESMGNTNKA